jgi:dTDP-glucose 4,6-dehydratase
MEAARRTRFHRPRSALVTGAGGFLGGHLAVQLARRGWLVRAFVRYNSRSDRGTLDWFEEGLVREIEVTPGDLRDVESVAQAVAGVEVVFHLGAQVAIPYSYRNARDFFETNVLGSLNVAASALDAGVERVIHISTSEVYGTARTIPMTESHPLEPQSPYAASKLGADKLMESFFRSFELPVTIVRPFNTYGPHQSARAIVPTIILQAVAGNLLHLGALDTRRDLTHVSDTVAGFITAAEAPAAVGRTLQLGTGTDVSVAELVQVVGELMERELTAEVDQERLRPPNSEVERLISDPGLAERLIGWKASTDLRHGLAQTIAWFEANADRYRFGEYVT